jgi:hypothetical protein
LPASSEIYTQTDCKIKIIISMVNTLKNVFK